MKIRGIRGLRARAALWGAERPAGTAASGCLWWSHIVKTTVLNSEKENDRVGKRPRRMSS